MLACKHMSPVSSLCRLMRCLCSFLYVISHHSDHIPHKKCSKKWMNLNSLLSFWKDVSTMNKYSSWEICYNDVNLKVRTNQFPRSFKYIFESYRKPLMSLGLLFCINHCWRFRWQKIAYIGVPLSGFLCQFKQSIRRKITLYVTRDRKREKVQNLPASTRKTKLRTKKRIALPCGP